MTNERQQKKLQRLALVSTVFTPGTPIRASDLFAGRMDQLLTLFGVLGQPGQHAAVYGERGVGKTSLANILGETFEGRHHERIVCVRVNCSTNDSFATLWRGILKKLGDHLEEHEVTVSRVLDELESRNQRTLIVIDELDRLEDAASMSLLADTIKALSDSATSSTVILVGVGDSIAEIIGDHRSVERALVQINMPRMSHLELVEIIDKGLARLGMTIEKAERRRIAALSEGLPSYTHLLSQHAAQKAIQDDRANITTADVNSAIRLAVEKAQHSILTDYATAIRSPRKDNKFAEVLLACALCRKDELGYFSPGAVREPLRTILQRNVRMSSFARHLNEFTTDAHHAILQKAGASRRYVYRFDNPILQPYVILRGLAEGHITETLLASLRPKPRESLFDDSEV